MMFKLNLQLFASKMGVGSTKNGRDSAGRRLGAKVADGQWCHAGSIIYRQRGTRIYPGENTKKGKDDTIFANFGIFSWIDSCTSLTIDNATGVAPLTISNFST